MILKISNIYGIFTILIRSRSSAWLERLTVTQEVESSSLFGSAGNSKPLEIKFRRLFYFQIPSYKDRNGAPSV